MIRRNTLIAAKRIVVAAVLCVCVILLASEAFAAGFVAQAVKVRGDVRITREGAGDMSVSQGTALQLGDIIKTGPGARLRLRFVNGSILALGENTAMSVDLFAVDATNKTRTVVLTVLEGIVNAAAAKSGESKFDYQIKTATGYSAVRGTKWIVGFRQSLMGVYVLNGTVEMGANSGTPPIMLNTGQWGSIDAAGTLSPAQTTTPEILKAIQDATSDTAGLSPVPNTPTVPTPTVPFPTVPEVPLGPKPNPRAEKGDKQDHEKYGGQHTD